MLNVKIIIENFKDLNKIEKLSLEAFPPEEYLAPSKIIEMTKDGDTEFMALYDEELFVGFVVLKKYKTICYLFFLAIDPTHRSKGYGAKAIKTIKELYPNSSHVVDFEMIDETKENNAQRIKRREFYLKNGYKPTNHFLSYLGVDYEIFSINTDFDFEMFKEMMNLIKVEGFNPSYFNH